MTKAKAQDSTEPVAETTNVEQPNVSITKDDLMYLYQLLVNSNIPVRDALGVVQLQQKLEIILKGR
jgi:hypothetical protein